MSGAVSGSRAVRGRRARRATTALVARYTDQPGKRSFPPTEPTRTRSAGPPREAAPAFSPVREPVAVNTLAALRAAAGTGPARAIASGTHRALN
jgi:hypothetical protein